MAEKKKVDSYQMVVEQIKTELENGTVPWTKPWVSRLGGQQNGITKRHYTGFNALILSMVADRRGYNSPYWLTAKKAFELGLELPKGNKGVKVIGWFKARKRNSEGELVENNDETSNPFLMPRAWSVFNFEQFVVPEGVKLPRHLIKSVEPKKVIDFNPLEEAENLIDKSGAKINLEASAAYYVPKRDEIFLPPPTTFLGIDEYYSTLFHELTHWTGHETRLKRFKTKECTRFNSTEYSKEELTAEMGSVFICSRLGITTDSQVRNSAAYLRGWLKYLTDHPKEFVNACQRAQKACDYVFELEAETKAG